MAIPFVFFVIAAFGMGVFIRPVVIVAFAFGVYCFEQWAQANSPFFGVNSALINLSFGVLTLMALIAVVLRGRNPITPITSSYVWFAALYLFAGVSCLWSLDRELSFFLFKYMLPYMVTFVILLPLVVQTDRDLNDGLIATLAFCSVVMMLLLIGTELHAFGRTIEAKIVNRVGQTDTRLAALATADMGGQLLIIAMLMNFRGVNRIWQQLRWPISVAAIILILRSESRGQLIAAFLVVLSLITISRGVKNALSWIAAGVSTVVIVTIAAWSFAGTVQNSRRWDVQNMQEVFAETRLSYVTTLLTYWAESSPVHWLVGLGSSASYDPRILGRYCHVVTAEVLGELGFFGLFLFGGFLLLVVRDALRLYQLTKASDVERGLTVTLIGLFMFQFLLSCKQGSFLMHTYTWCFGLLISRQAAIKQTAFAKQRSRELGRRWYAWYRWQQQQSATPSTPTM